MHADYTLLMSLALDHEASGEERRRLDEHLATCAECMAQWEAWQAVDRRFAVAPMVSPPADLLDRISARLDAVQATRGRRRWLGPWLLVAWGMILGLALLFLAGLAWWGYRHPLEAGFFLSFLAQMLSGVRWLLWGIETLARSLGGSPLAFGVGVGFVLSCTGALIVAWLWMVSRRVRSGDDRALALR